MRIGASSFQRSTELKSSTGFGPLSYHEAARTQRLYGLRMCSMAWACSTWAFRRSPSAYVRCQKPVVGTRQCPIRAIPCCACAEEGATPASHTVSALTRSLERLAFSRRRLARGKKPIWQVSQ